MNYILTILQYAGVALFVVFFFGFCIFIHELGHFLAAKWRGLHVIAFSIGFKKIWAFKHKGVEYRIGCIPCGGYVDLPQIDAVGQPKTEDGKLLPRGKPIDRIITAFAGPFFNVLFGFFLGTFIWFFGIPQDSPKMDEIKVAEIILESPEYKAGLRIDDVIYKINGSGFYSTWNNVVKDILFAVGDIKLAVKDGKTGEEKSVTYKPIVNPNVMPDEKIAYPFFKPKLPVVLYPFLDSAAAKAGIKDGDEVIKANGEPINNIKELQRLIITGNGKSVDLTIQRRIPKTDDTEEVSISVTPKLKETAYLVGVTHSLRKPLTFKGTEYKIPYLVDSVSKDSAADKAGLKEDDIILTMNGELFKKPADFSKAIRACEGNSLELSIKRGDKVFTKTLIPKMTNMYAIGVQFAFINHPTPWQQFIDVIDMSYKSMRGIIFGLIGKSTLRPSHMSGPIGIIRVISTAVYRGSYIQGLYIIVIITFSLAILNLMPIPVLDGGHILLAVLESLIGKPLPARLVQPITLVFITVLISLMIFVTFYDAKRVIKDFTGRAASKQVQEKTNVPAINKDADTDTDTKTESQPEVKAIPKAVPAQ